MSMNESLLLTPTLRATGTGEFFEEAVPLLTLPLNLVKELDDRELRRVGLSPLGEGGDDRLRGI
jgi:hypothetical protein